MQLLFVNGRLLRSTLFAGAWSAGYATYAMTQRQPFGVLFVTVPPDGVDPNVHPTKSDVRLRHGARVSDRVRRAIVATLERDARTRVGAVLSCAPDAVTSAAGFAHALPFQLTTAGLPETQSVGGAESEQGLRILAQLDDTYILGTDGAALVLVDQHAAHERIAFEEIAARGEGVVRSEPLLVPETIELDAARWERLEAVRADLVAAGLEIEPFGERTYRIVATPAGYGARTFDLRRYVDDLDCDIRGLDARGRAWATLACHSVVRAGERLESAEMSALLARLVRCSNPMHCPHGRPTMVRIEADEIARIFKRM
jgi:DNA mismatch repair protein MutL